LLNEKRFLLITGATGLFLIFTVFTAPLFSVVSFTSGGGFKQQAVNNDPYYLLRQASAQEESTPPTTLPFTPFSLQQQETVPEQEQEQQQPTDDEGDQSLTQEPPPTVTEETPPPAAADDDQTTFQARPGQNVPLTPQPNEPTTRQGGDQSEGSNTTTPSGDRQIESIAREGSFGVSSLRQAGEAHCGDAERRTGGGFNLPTPTIQVFSSSSSVSAWGWLNGWELFAKNTVSGSDSAELYAVCAKITPEGIVNNTNPSCGWCKSGTGFIQTYVREGGRASIEPNSQKAAVARCSGGEEITGGGFGALAYTERPPSNVPTSNNRDYSDPDIRFYKSYPSGNGWAVEAKSNHQTLPTELNVYAVCAKVITSISQNFTQTVSRTEQVESNPRYVPLTVSPNSQNSVVSSCREGEAITAGGWYSQSPDVYVYKSYPSGENGWAVEAYNWNPTEGRSLSVYAMCARVVSIAQPITPATVPPPTGNATGATTMTPSTNDTGAASASATEPPLRVEAIANATQAVAPATIRLDANITGGAPPYSYTWSDPNLGLIDQDRSITLNFFEPGTFTYTLTVVDSRGKTVTDNVQIVISERLPQGGDVVAPEPGGVAPPQEEGGLLPSTPPLPPNDNEVIPPPEGGGTPPPPTTEEGGEEPSPPPPDDTGGEGTPPDEETPTPPDGE
jgi:hypothetical protein